MGNSKITFYGGTDIEYISIEDEEVDITEKLSNTYEPVLRNNTIFLNTFNGNLTGTGITHDTDKYSYSIYKVDLDSSDEMRLLTTITSGKMGFMDYNIANNKQYKYIIYAETERGMANAKETEVVNTHWDSWSITGLINTEDPNVFKGDEDNIWVLNLSLETAEQNQNFQRTEYKNLTAYPKISQGVTNYISGSISCLLGEINNAGKYVEPKEKLEAWRKFINSPNLKILKDRKGHKYLVQTMSSSNKILDYTSEQMNRISFGYTEVGTTLGKVIYS